LAWRTEGDAVRKEEDDMNDGDGVNRKNNTNEELSEDGETINVVGGGR
jgi:hypothetical protein